MKEWFTESKDKPPRSIGALGMDLGWSDAFSRLLPPQWDCVEQVQEDMHCRKASYHN